MYDFKGNGFSEEEEKQFGVYVNDLSNSGLTKEQMGLAFGAMKHSQDNKQRNTVDLDSPTGISTDDARAEYMNGVEKGLWTTKEKRVEGMKEIIKNSRDEKETTDMFKTKFGYKTK